MTELYWKPAHELAAMIRKRELKPSELMDVTIRRIEQTNPKINAFVALRADAAMAEARALDEKIARGEKVGTLAGLPLGVKDLEDTVGLVNSHGSKPFKDNMAKTDSIQVARLKAAGAIVIGKTNAPEFGYTAFTKNLLFGPTRNPWNLERTPGGSSGGTSAAIAARRRADFDRLRRRRLGANPRVLHRMLRAEAELRQDSERPDARDATMERHLACTGRSRAPCATPRSSWTRWSAIIRPIPTRCRIREFPTRRSSRACRKNCASRFIPTSASSCSTTSRAKSRRPPPCSRTSATA